MIIKVSNTMKTTNHKKWKQIINVGEGVEKKEPSYIASGNINWYNHYGEQYGVSLKN